MTRKDIPNIISFFRILLTLPVVYYLVNEQFSIALWLFVVAGVSDGLDGFLAKRFGWTSELGGKLDPAADKLLLTFCYLTLGWMSILPVWFVTLVVLRDVIIVAGWIAYNRWVEVIQAHPIMISKLNTVMQIVLVVYAVVIQVTDVIPANWLYWVIALTAVTTIISGLSYIFFWGKRAYNMSR